MTRLLSLLLILVTHAAFADAVPGADDPAYGTAISQLMAADDPAALQRLHDLATGGNTAALIALPTALRWMPDADRALRKMGGEWVADLVHDYKPADLWDGGAISPASRDQLNRALWLYELGQTAKADVLLAAWVAHMPEAAALPDGFQDLPAAPVLKAMILLQHMVRGDRKALPALQYFLDQDRIEGWMVLAELTDHYPVTGGQPMIASLKLGPNIATRLQDGRRAQRLLWHEDPPPPLPDVTLDMALRDLIPRPQFAPVRAYCAAACPGTAPACEAAFVTLLGVPHHSVASMTPLAMDPATFFATPRGERALLSGGLHHRLQLERAVNPAARLPNLPAYFAARAIDTCLADGALRSLGPMPQNP